MTKLEADNLPTIQADHLRQFSERCFVRAGFSEDDAVRATDVLLFASLRGVDTHGIRNLKSYYIDSAGGVGRRDGLICHDAVLEVDHETSTTAAMNANGGLGLAVSTRAMDLAIEKAAEHGLGLVTVRNSTHFGAAGYYAYQAAQRDMIGFAATGYFFANGQPKAVLPFGGLLPMFSTNPFSMAFPSGRHEPFLLDMATSVVPVNRIEMLEELGKRIPWGWAMNDDHQPTDDPAAVSSVEPLGGATTYGGHKGYGMALATWILTGLLSGAWRTNPKPDRVLGATGDTKNGFAQEGIGHVFAAVRLDCFGAPEDLKRGMDSMRKTINESPAADGFPQVLIPGQPEEMTLAERTANGIPLPASTLAMLNSLADEFEIPLELNF